VVLRLAAVTDVDVEVHHVGKKLLIGSVAGVVPGVAGGGGLIP
jgi:hypothetical protein